MRKRKGLILVNTGDGKGKTTASMGLALRASGHGMKVLFVQFIKGGWKTGEGVRLPELPGVEHHVAGKGFTIPKYRRRPWPEHLQAVADAWALVQARVEEEQFDVVILDEINNVLSNERLSEALPLEELIEFLERKPEMMHVVLTGRRAPQELIDVADTVTEMKLVKHVYKDKGIPAQRGIEF